MIFASRIVVLISADIIQDVLQNYGQIKKKLVSINKIYLYKITNRSLDFLKLSE